MLKAVIWDMDGVIIDSEPIYHRINKLIFKKLGVSISDEEYDNFIGGDDSRLWDYVKEKGNLSYTIDELLEIEFEEDIIYFKNCDDPVMEGVVDLLEDLRKNNIKTAIASSSMRKLILTIVKRLGIEHYFSPIVSGDDVEKGKPEPDIFLLAAKFMGVEPFECIVIEDSENGLKASKSAGIKCIGIKNPSSGEQNLELADLKVNSLKEVNVEIIKNMLK